MAFDSFGYEWHGAFRDAALLEDRAGVYAVWSRVGDAWTLLDIGESGTVQTRLLGHDRRYQWTIHARGGDLYFAATYTPGLQQPGRRNIEQALRAQLRPPCGDR